MLNKLSQLIYGEVVTPKEFVNRKVAIGALLFIIWGVLWGLPMLVRQPWFKALFPTT